MAEDHGRPYNALMTRSLIVPWRLLACVLMAASRPAWAAKPAPGALITEIEVETHDVFDTKRSSQDHLVFRAANALHVTTRQSIVRRELLFKEGDRIDPALLHETERNLRRLNFLRKAEVEAVATSSGTARIIVRTYDAWTLEALGNFKQAGGATSTRMGLADRNILGYGKTVSWAYSGGGQAYDRTFMYRDPQLFGQRGLESSVSAGEAPDNRHYSFFLGRPFYASIAGSALSLSGDYADDRATVYSDRTPVGLARRRAVNAGVTYGKALEASPRLSRRLTFGVLEQRADYSLVAGGSPLLPESAQMTFLQTGAEYQVFDFVKLRRIQKLSRDEDFNRGLGILPSVSWAPRSRLLGSRSSQLKPKLSVRKGFSSELGHLVLLRADYGSTYVNGGNGARLGSLGAQYYCRYYPRHTMAVNASFDHGRRLDPAGPLSLGEDSGLRGYRAHSLQGDRRLLFNLEDRVFFFEDWLQLVDMGAVVFFDSGYAWPSGATPRIVDLKSSVGLGLRLGATRSSANEPLRIDVAHALNDNGLRSRWSVSVLAGHAFGNGP